MIATAVLLAVGHAGMTWVCFAVMIAFLALFAFFCWIVSR